MLRDTTLSESRKGEGGAIHAIPGAPKLNTALAPAAPLAPDPEFVGLGAPEEPPDELVPDALPVGRAKPVMLPEKGPGAVDATAPEPLRAPVGTPGSAVVLAFAAACNAVKLAASMLIPLIWRRRQRRKGRRRRREILPNHSGETMRNW